MSVFLGATKGKSKSYSYINEDGKKIAILSYNDSKVLKVGDKIELKYSMPYTFGVPHTVVGIIEKFLSYFRVKIDGKSYNIPMEQGTYENGISTYLAYRKHKDGYQYTIKRLRK